MERFSNIYRSMMVMTFLHSVLLFLFIPFMFWGQIGEGEGEARKIGVANASPFFFCAGTNYLYIWTT